MDVIESSLVWSGSSPISQAIRAGEYLFVSGQIPRNTDGTLVSGDFGAEVRAVLDNVKGIVEAAGGDVRQICKLNAYLTEGGLFEEFNEIYRAYFGDAPYPARTTVCCALARPGIRVEVEAIAWLA